MDRGDKSKQLIRDFQGTFDTPDGKRVLENLSAKCREHEATYRPGSFDATAYYEGMRSVILYIRAQLAKDPNIVRQTETVKEKDE